MGDRVLCRIVLFDWFRGGGLLGDPFEGALDRRRDWRRGRDVGTGHLGAEFVGGPAHGNGSAIRRIILYGALNELRLVGSASVLAATALALEYAALGLVGE